MNFHQNSLSSFQLTEWTQNCIYLCKWSKGNNCKICKADFCSCTWHIVSLCSTTVWGFIRIARTVFNWQNGHKIAFTNVPTGMIWKIYMHELLLLCMTRRLNVLYKCMTFRKFKVANKGPVVSLDGRTDRQADGQKKTICLTTLKAGGITKYTYDHTLSSQTY